MQQKTISTIEWASSASKAGTAHFGDIVWALVEAGVESYHADYRAGRTTYYLPDGDTHTVALIVAAAKIAEAFDAEAIITAIKGSQRGEVAGEDTRYLYQKQTVTLCVYPVNLV